MKTDVIKIHPDYPEMDKIMHCAKVVRQGGLVIFPTETVYGIAANFNDPEAMIRLREVKQRSKDKPFSILISQRALLSNYTPTTNTSVFKLIDHFWPGPLTVIVPSNQEGKTIGIRMPDHNIALKLVEEAQCTIAAPSANIEGKPAPQNFHDALKDLEGLVDVAIDGGDARYGRGSSVIDFTKNKPEILREGAVTKDDLEFITKKKTVLFVCTGNSCRSVMAEYSLKKLLAERRDVEVVSAGTCVFLKSTASAETVSVLAREGVDATRHLSQPLTPILAKKADLILVMTKIHRQQVLERVPSVENRIYLLKEFASNTSKINMDMDIPDPIGKPAEAYEESLLTIKDAVSKIVNLI